MSHNYEPISNVFGVAIYKQEAHGPKLTHLSETATADMQMACNIFLILSNIETYDKAMA